MEISIETLTGNSFELRVSPFETVISVKQKIQRLEGIPIAQQHLIWKNIELEDDFYLHDYGISHGSCLQLVLAMRGGPISTRRVVLEDPSLQEVIDYVEANGEDMWNDLPTSDSTQVTVLLFRDGDQLNFFRVIDRGDGTLTPLSESLSGNSMYNLYDEDEDSSMEERSSENAAMRDKVRNLKAKMRVLNATKKFPDKPVRSRDVLKPSPPPRPPMGPLPPHRTPRPPSDLNTPRNLASVSSGMIRRRMYSKIEDISPKHHVEEMLPPLSGRSRQLPKITRSVSKDRNKSTENVNPSRFSSSSFDSAVDNSQPIKSRVSSAKQMGELQSPDKASSLPVSAKSLKDTEKVNQYKRYTQNKRDAVSGSDPMSYLKQCESETKQVLPDDIVSASREVSARISSRISHNKLGASESINKITKHVTYDINTRTNNVTARDLKNVDGKKSVVHRLNSSDRKNLRTLQVLSRQGSASPPSSPLPSTRLPPVALKTKVISGKKKSTTRCNFCKKKTGLATTYTCHCEGTFCATHRYAEVHKCPYDYKTAGRKILEQNNPVVTAPKLPKI